MTVRVAHPTHRWNHQTGECRLCHCSSTKKTAEMPCLRAPVAAPKAQQTRRAGAPDLHAASLRGARDLVPSGEW